MKKYIVLIMLGCFAFSNLKPHEGGIPQDSIEILTEQLKEAVEDPNNIDSEKVDRLSKAIAKEATLVAKKAVNSVKKIDYNFSVNKNINSQDKKPTRIDKKTIKNIKAIEFTHSYGNIVLRESSAKDVELEIQYFDVPTEKALCTVTSVGQRLDIKTEKAESKKGERPSINYIVNVPKKTSLSFDVRYGDIKMGNHEVPTIYANLAYSDLSMQNLDAGRAVIKAKYSDVKIENIRTEQLIGSEGLLIDASYSDFKIGSAQSLSISGNYSDYKLGEIENLVIGYKFAYGDFKIGSIGTMKGKLQYADVVITNLLKAIDITSNYGDISIRSVAPKFETVAITANYCDVSIGLSPSISANFDATLNYGDLNIAKTLNVKYSISNKTGNSVIKKGQIGHGNAKGNIVVSNNYADIDIK